MNVSILPGGHTAQQRQKTLESQLQVQHLSHGQGLL